MELILQSLLFDVMKADGPIRGGGGRIATVALVHRNIKGALPSELRRLQVFEGMGPVCLLSLRQPTVAFTFQKQPAGHIPPGRAHPEINHRQRLFHTVIPPKTKRCRHNWQTWTTLTEDRSKGQPGERGGKHKRIEFGRKTHLYVTCNIASWGEERGGERGAKNIKQENSILHFDWIEKCRVWKYSSFRCWNSPRWQTTPNGVSKKKKRGGIKYSVGVVQSLKHHFFTLP